MKKIIALVALLAKIIALVALVAFAGATVFAQKYASVNAKRANIRSCAGTKCSIKWYAWKYTPVIMVKTNEDKSWVLVKDFEGFSGWISADLLSPAGGMSAKVDLNVRKDPSASAEIVCTVEFSDVGVWQRYTRDNVRELMLAYACTVHKAQGMERDTVIVVASTQHKALLQRNLFYTD